MPACATPGATPPPSRLVPGTTRPYCSPHTTSEAHAWQTSSPRSSGTSRTRRPGCATRPSSPSSRPPCASSARPPRPATWKMRRWPCALPPSSSTRRPARASSTRTRPPIASPRSPSAPSSSSRHSQGLPRSPGRGIPRGEPAVLARPCWPARAGLPVLACPCWPARAGLPVLARQRVGPVGSTTMSRLAARGIRVVFGGLTVLDGVDLTLGPGDRVGIVAPNGVGKSTLLRVLAGELEPDSGTVTRTPATTTVVRLAQEPDIQSGETLAELLVRGTAATAAQAALDESTGALTRGDRGADDAYAAALERWLGLGSADL